MLNKLSEIGPVMRIYVCLAGQILKQLINKSGGYRSLGASVKPTNSRTYLKTVLQGF